MYWTYTGTLTGEDLLQSNFEIYGDERFDDLTYQIVNLLEVDKVDVSENHMRKVAHLDMAAARSNKRIRIAVVARTPEAIALNTLYEKYVSGDSWPSRLFETVEEAEAWIHAPRDLYPPEQ